MREIDDELMILARRICQISGAKRIELKNQLAEMLWPELFGFLKSTFPENVEECEDTTQDIIIEALKVLGERPKRGKFLAYWKKAAKHKMFDKFRTPWEWRKCRVCLDEVLIQIENDPDRAHYDNETKETVDAFKGILDLLPELQRPMFKMYFIDEMSVAEIAKDLKLTRPAVYMRIVRCRKSAKKILKNIETHGIKFQKHAG